MPGNKSGSGWRTIPTRYIVRKKQAFKVEPIPVDHDQFRQCHQCGLIVPVYELEKEATIKDAISTTDDPFDIAKNEILGVDSRKTARKKRKQRDREKEYDHIKEQDLKNELRKGSTLLSYSEQMPL
jgi:hypothetical protein